jgi:hypothetical protein
LENERLGLLIEQARIAGMLSVIEQMIAQLDAADGSAAIPEVTLDQLQAGLIAAQIGVEAHEHPVYP